jgi:hypothetical protein
MIPTNKIPGDPERNDMKPKNEATGHYEVNEYDIHDMLAKRSFVSDPGIEDIHQVTVVPENPDFPAAEWEKRINDLLETIDTLDGLIHDEAEYTCR